MSWWESCMAKKVSEFMRRRYNLYMPTEEPRLSPCSFKYKGLSLWTSQEPSTHIQNGAYPFTCRDGGNQDSRRVGPGLWEGQHPPLLGSEP